ncbi:hypothetical protein AS188_14335 [Kocuria flava]|uniref:Uncharacterized protein n=1 Tax=Kocuria flava TaxID=446860 RepID=A0A0U3HHS6_9MICC|nr:hypothetical protein AS188_14335 [Kocuria flava]
MLLLTHWLVGGAVALLRPRGDVPGRDPPHAVPARSTTTSSGAGSPVLPSQCTSARDTSRCSRVRSVATLAPSGTAARVASLAAARGSGR